VDCRRYTDCWSTGWGSEIFPDANIPTFYSDALRLVNHSFISKSLHVLVFFKVVSNEQKLEKGGWIGILVSTVSSMHF
jgi:hypothetical protein